MSNAVGADHDAVRHTIAMAQGKLADLEGQVKATKRMVNELCGWIGQPPIYEISDADKHTTVIRSDEFYGQPLAKVVRSILEKRRAANLGAAAISEIYDAMVHGGYAFETEVPTNAKRNLRISLTKNSSTFHRLPNGKVGLLEWYPSARETRPAKQNGGREGTNGEELPDESLAERDEEVGEMQIPVKPR